MRFFCLLLCLCVSMALAQDCSQTATRCVGSGQEYTTIQAAANAAAAGDTVYVFNGNYAGFHMTNGAGNATGTSSSPITFQAQSASVVINSNDTTYGHGINVNQRDYIIINGFTVTGRSSYGIFIAECDGCQILNNTVSTSSVTNILTGFCYRCLIQSNTVSSAGSQHGIYVSNSARGVDAPVVRGNISYSNAGAGIQFNGDCNTLDHLGHSDGMISGALIENNIVHDNAASAYSIINVSDSVFRNNVNYNNDTVATPGAFKLADEGGCNLGSNRNLIVNNTNIAHNAEAAYRIISGVGNVIWNGITVNNNGFDCVIDATATACDSGGTGGNYFQTGIKRTLAQAASGIFTDFTNHDFTLTSGSPAQNAGISTFRGFASPVVDILVNTRPEGGVWDLGAYERSASAAGSDTTVPSTPGNPSAVVSPSSVIVTWNGSTDNRELLWYWVYRDGSLYGISTATAFADTAVSSGFSYVYKVVAVDGAGNISAESGTVSATIPGIVGCMNADTTWRNQALPTLTGTFTVETDVTPFVLTANDGVVGLSKVSATSFTSLGVITIFHPDGTIKARNGSSYTADATVTYTLGTAYHIRMVVNTTAHTYDVYVTPDGGSETQIASGYAFRTEQSSMSSVNYVAVCDDAGSISACNISVDGEAVSSMQLVPLIAAVDGTTSNARAQGTDRPVLSRSAVQTITGTTKTLAAADAGNQVLRFTSSSPTIVTVPTGLPTNLAFTLVQLGTGSLSIQAQSGVTLIQRQNQFTAAGRGSPITIQSTGVSNEYVVWGDLQ